jgi:hypothetical protein
LDQTKNAFLDLVILFQFFYQEYLGGTMILQKNNLYSVECHTKIAKDCSGNGGWCDSEEEAQEWVEDECWLFSGDGWFCNECNSHFMRNLSQTRRDKGLDSLLPDGWDDNLEVGINTVR